MSNLPLPTDNIISPDAASRAKSRRTSGACRVKRAGPEVRKGISRGKPETRGFRAMITFLADAYSDLA